MRSSAITLFPSFSKRFEARLGKMYLDVNGDVTAAVGNRMDPVNQAFGLGWLREQDDVPASPADVQRVWTFVKGLQGMKLAGGGAFQSLPGNDIYLPARAIDALVEGKRLFDESEYTRDFFPGFADFPAEGQLGIASMAWAMGPERFREFPKFVAAVNRGDWKTAAAESHMNDAKNPGLVPRNAANKILFENADVVTRLGLDPDRITWPAKLDPGLGGGGGGSPTDPTAVSHSESFWGACILGGGILGGLFLMRSKGWIG